MEEETEKYISDEFWAKLPKEFVKLEEKEYKDLKKLSDGTKPEAVFAFNGEYIVFNAYPEGMEFVDVYEQQLNLIEKQIKGKLWRKVSPIKPVFHKWLNIKDKKVYFSIFESYNSFEKLSLQMFIETNVMIGISTSIKKESNLSLEKLANENELVKKLIKALI